MKTVFRSLFTMALLFVFNTASAFFIQFPLYIRLTPYPSDAGLVYLGWNNIKDYNDLRRPPQHFWDNGLPIPWAETAELNIIIISGHYWVYTTPNEGYTFLGFSRAVYAGELGETLYTTDWSEDLFPFNDNILTSSNPAYFQSPYGAYQRFWADFGADDLELLDVPNEYCFALFARVTVAQSPGGTAKITNGSDPQSDITNSDGDEVTILATPDSDEHPFLYWTESGTGRQITDNPYTFTVTEQREYTPCFDNVSGITPLHGDARRGAEYSIDGRKASRDYRGIVVTQGRKVVSLQSRVWH